MNSNKIYTDHITPDDIRKYKSHKRDIEPTEDTRVVKNLIRDMGNFTRLVGHYSAKFDIPFVRTRAVIDNVSFPEFGEYYQTDTWFILKKKFRLRRNSLENACRKLIGVSNKDHLSLSLKHAVLRGEKWAIDATIEHCRKDVLDTEMLYKKIFGYMKTTKCSI